MKADPEFLATQAPPTQRMQCMEVWGGNRQVERAFEMPGLEVWIYSQPHQSAAGGGDVYYVSSCASGRITRTLLADVSGHGEEVSALAAGLRDLMRRNVNVISQRSFTAAMNQQFGELAAHGGFATALVSTFFSPTQSLAVSNAGHPLPLIRRHDSGQWQPLGEVPSAPGSITNTPLGVANEAEYPGLETRLRPGDQVLLYSDALSESRDAEQRLLGTDGLRDVLQSLGSVAPQRLIPSLLDALRAVNPHNLAEDDVTVVLLRATGSQPTWKDNLLAPWRLIGGVNDATTLDT